MLYIQQEDTLTRVFRRRGVLVDIFIQCSIQDIPAMQCAFARIFVPPAADI